MKLVVFDMAGTVVNEHNVVYKTLQRAIVEGGVAVTLDQVLAEGAGKEKLKAIEDIVALWGRTSDRERVGEMYTNFKTLLDKAYDSLNVTPMLGAEQVFTALREQGIKVALNTGYSQDVAEKLVNKLGWSIGNTYDALVTASQVRMARPFPDMIFKAMEVLGIEDAETVAKVGDSIIDIEEGRNAECGITIGITTGAHSRTQLNSANPDYIVDHLTEVVPLMQKKD